MADKSKGALSAMSGESDVMGVLQSLSLDPVDKENQNLAFAAGILAPTRGGGASEALSSGLSAMYKARSDQDQLKAQYVPHITNALLSAAKFQQEQAEKQWLMQMLSGQGAVSSPVADNVGGQAGALPTPQGGLQTATATRSSGFPLDINQVAALKAITGKDLLPEYKYANDGVERKPGSYYDVNGRREYVADPTKGLQIGQDGSIGVMPGFSEANASIKGAETAAIEKAKAANQLAPIDYARVGPEGVVTPKSVATVLSEGKPERFKGESLFVKLPAPLQKQMVAQAQKDGNTYQKVEYKLPSGELVKGEIDFSIAGDAKPTNIQTEAQREDAVGKEKVENAVSEALQKEGYQPSGAGYKPIPGLKPELEEAERQQKKESAILSTDKTIATIDRLIKSPGREWATGSMNLGRFIPGSPGADFAAELETLKAQTFLPMVAQMKGMGALDKAEGARLEAAVGALDATKMSEQAFLDSLQRIKKDFEDAKTRLVGVSDKKKNGAAKFLGFE